MLPEIPVAYASPQAVRDEEFHQHTRCLLAVAYYFSGRRTCA